MPGGGDPTERDVMGYQPPQGPRHVMDTGVGLRGGSHVGDQGVQEHTGEVKTSGRVSQLTSKNYGNCGSQGCR